MFDSRLTTSSPMKKANVDAAVMPYSRPISVVVACEVLQLRKQRSQATTTLIGLLYGITAASTFAFFIGLEVVNLLSNMDVDLDASAGFDAGQLISTGQYNIALIEFLLVVIIMFSAMLSALMIRTVDGGHKINAYFHFVLMAWISAVVAIITKWIINVFLAI